MYTPPKFNVTDIEMIAQLVRENSFATVISYPDDIFINHLPLIYEAGSADVLIGHMSRKNPQWEHFQKNPKATVIIHGPHAYISPSWYRSGRDVPTWNYAVVHLQGRVEIVEDFRGQVKILKAASEYFEQDFENSWRFSLPDDLKTDADLTAAIVSFRFVIEKTEAKFKLSQNRGVEDQEGVREGLAERGDEQSLKVRELMKGTT